MTPYLLETEITKYCASPGLTLDDVNVASATIDSYVGRSFGIVTHTEQAKLTKKNSPYGKVFKGKLRHFPRVTITSITAKVPSYFGGLETAVYDPTNLWFDDDQFEYFTFLPPAMGNMGIATVSPALFAKPIPVALDITYTSGYTIIPDEIKIACGQVMDAIKINGGTTTWKSRTDFDMSIILSDNEDPILSNTTIKLLELVRLS